MFHDFDLRKMCGSPKLIATMSAEELSHTPFVAPAHSKEAMLKAHPELAGMQSDHLDITIPTLDQVRTFILSLSLSHAPSLTYLCTIQQAVEVVKSFAPRHLFVEGKEMLHPYRQAKLIVEAFERHDMYEWSHVISFNPILLYWVRKLDARISTSLLVERYYIGSLKDGWSTTSFSGLPFSPRQTCDLPPHRLATRVAMVLALLHHILGLFVLSFVHHMAATLYRCQCCGPRQSNHHRRVGQEFAKARSRCQCVGRESTRPQDAFAGLGRLCHH